MSDIPVEKVYRFGKKVVLYLEDCYLGMQKYLKTGEVDVVVTSPPYNIGIQYNKYNDNMPKEEYLDWLENIAVEIKRVLADDGSFFLNVGGKPSDPWIPLDVAERMRKHFVLQNVIHWVKSIAIEKKFAENCSAIEGDIAVGHYKPISGKRFLHDNHEYIFHFTKTGKVELDRLAIGVPCQDESSVGKRCRGNTWFIPYETIWSREKQRPHPSTFPVALPEMCIKLHGLNKTKLVLDPFMGIGTTTVACMRLNVGVVGFEIDEEYMKTAVERLQAFIDSKDFC